MSPEPAISDLLRALDDPTRLRLLRLLARMELAVGELAEVLDQSQPRISRHIRILTEARLVEKRKEGSWVFLKARLGAGPPCSRDSMAQAVGALLVAAEREDAAFAQCCEADRSRLAAVRETREAEAARYFARHAPEWDRLRSLHIADEPVEAELSRLLGVELGGAGAGTADRVAGNAERDTPLGRLLDIGTGTGRMAELFAPAATHVAAIDKSPEMLRLARARLQHLPPARLTLVQGDFAALPFADGAFDTVLFHQVLHYAPAPEAALAEAARVTHAGGRIAIVDFAAHTHEELRATHAHERLGFDDAQMTALLENAGFAMGEDAALAGSRLTVRIWTGTRRSTVHRLPEPQRPTRKAARS